MNSDTVDLHPGQHPIDEDLVRRLVADRFPQWAGLPVTRFPSGGTVNAMYRLGEEMVVRLPLVDWGAPDAAMEREWLPRLAPLLPVAVPEVLGAGGPAEGYPWSWSVYRWQEGAHPRPGALREPVRLAEDLAGFVTAIRSLTLPDAPPAYRGGPIGLLDEETRTAIGELRALPEEGVDCAAVTAVWEDALGAPAWDGRTVWLHSDLMPGNLLVDGGGRLTAVIDFGCAGAGDPSCDLMPAWNLLPADARAVYRAALDVDDATWRRGRGRALALALNALPYYRETNAAMAENARHVIREILAES
ncbi:aminoglycoside phosphotransferase family protein [Kitasatospora purpeofusca]|uniref:aminoglycoside phosphotransferase family protein n=1 Tax=Kitasatospora purpeofusca TaxID=67352 RepID=UPI002A5A94F3|nr:aminoglycoside phosphotransferase family protein [Kitasatospora purpeofusca]MDY0810295.1 aminoglycoside phosphotransferase family protein [Kitasatospora purpeofusca]